MGSQSMPFHEPMVYIINIHSPKSSNPFQEGFPTCSCFWI